MPPEGAAPYPTIHFYGGMTFSNALYAELIDEWNKRGYAVVVFQSTSERGERYHCTDCEDLFCSWAWLQARGTEYGLDPERTLSFAHGYGMFTLLMALGDEALWDDFLTTCPQPTPASAEVKAVVTYDGLFGLPEGDLVQQSWAMAATYGVPHEELLTIIDALQEAPPETWPHEGLLTAEARRVASFLPLYYVNDPRPPGGVPSFLVMHGDEEQYYDFVCVDCSLMMAREIADAMLPVETWHVEGGQWASIISDGKVEIADAVDAFAREVFGDDM
ncbi:MAG: alpha/beta hydrolase family protein [Anaerolineae bacterium]